MTNRIASLTVLAAAAVVLAGCSSSAEPADDGTIAVIASTNVYADIAASVAGDDAVVTALITSGAQDPHEYEATAKDRLAVSKAALVVRNGGGYDAFIDGMITDGVPVVTAAELAPDYPATETHDHATETDADHDHATETEADHDHAAETDAAHDHATETDAAHDHADDGHDHIAGFNEHVWYDPEIMSTVAQHIAEELSVVDPANASAYAERSAAFQADMKKLDTDLAALESAHGGAAVFATEPVGLRLLERAGLDDKTPAAFGEAVEEGQDVPPATLLEALDIVSSGSVNLVVVNTQTGGAETDRIESAAAEQGLPLVALSELLPEGEDYASWMGGVIGEIAQALA